MAETGNLDGRVTQWRLFAWLATSLLAYFVFRASSPAAWQIAAFGAVFSPLWHVLRREKRPSRGDDTAVQGGAPTRLPSVFAVDIGMDLIVTTLLVHFSGGFGSPFAWLYMIAVIEAYVLLGTRAALAAAVTAAVLNLFHFQPGVLDSRAAAVYGMTAGSLLVSALIVARASRNPDDAGSPFASRRAPLVRTRDAAVLEQELEEANRAHNQLKDTYREVARLNREQKAALTRLQTADALLTATVRGGGEGSAPYAAHAALLSAAMNALDAGGAALWIRHGDTLRAAVVAGRTLPLNHFEPITGVSELTPADLRARCTVQMLEASPATALVPVSEVYTDEASALLAPPELPESEPGTHPDSSPVSAHPVLLEVLREAGEHPEIVAVIGLCDPRGMTRFNAQDSEKLRTLHDALAAALENAEHRRAHLRRIAETTLLYELSRLVQNAGAPEQIYKSIVSLTQKAIACENVTLFLFDKDHAKLEARATRGRVVDLLSHIVFEKGQGVSGWVASRGRQVVIADLKQETNLLNSETIPPRVRSFVATPLRVHNAVVGVLSVSDAEPNAFAAEDLQLLAVAANQAAVTIEHTDAFHTLETLAITDGLTLTYNHRYFQMRLEDELRRCKRYKTPLSVILLDADHFKRVNDRHGHASGDSVLRDLGALLKQSVRETEIVARYGGEEFAVMLPHTDMEQALVAAERIRANIASLDFHAVDGETLRITASLGLATYPVHGIARAELLEQADRALYAAKNNGRNQISLAQPPQTALVLE